MRGTPINPARSRGRRARSFSVPAGLRPRKGRKGKEVASFARGSAVGTTAAALILTALAPIPSANAEAFPEATGCLAAGNVWVLVERDTGAQAGGCATEFGDGLEALQSAGFTVNHSDGFITHIGGHPTGAADQMYWSYWQLGTGAAAQWQYSQLGAALSSPEPGTVEGWRFVSWAGGAMAEPPNWRPTPPPSPTPTPTPTPTKGPTTKPVGPVDVYSEPGYHTVSGRRWHTACEPYSQTVRCRTELWATQVTSVGGRFVQKNGWAFNNLTYQPKLTRAQWAGNPLGATGEFESAGRGWRTECDTALTGRGACRSFVWQPNRIAAHQDAGGAWRYRTEPGWVFNNLVRFA